MTVNVMSGTLGDIFWDLSPWIAYEPGYDLGCGIYVANPSATEKEYALMARFSRAGVVISEEVLPVFGQTWFTVAPGDFVKLKGALRFDESDGELAVLLVERETEEVTDSVVTLLSSSANAGVLPPAWPGGAAGSSGFDWTSLMYAMIPFAMIGAMVSPSKQEEPDKETKTLNAAEERKLLTEGRPGDAR